MGGTPQDAPGGPGYPPAPPPGFGPPGAFPPQPPPGYSAPGYGPPGWQTTGTTRKGLPGRTAVVSIVAVLAALASGFAVVNIATGGESGAASPEAAVEDFFGAIGDQDAIGVLEKLDPGERDLMMPFVKDLESDLSRLGLTEDMDLSNVPGVELEVTGLEVEAEELEPGLSQVNVTAGEISYETLPDDVPIGNVLNDLIEANDGEVDIRAESDSADLAEDPEEPIFLMATESGGRWHVSLGFTIAEYARQSDYEPQPRPALADAIEPDGADSPEEAVQNFAAAASEVDMERMISLLPPDSMRALQVYAPMFLEDAQRDVDESIAEEGLELDIQVNEMDTSDVDVGTRVVPTNISVSYSTDEDGESTMTYDGDCLEVEGEMADEFNEDMGDSKVCWEDVSESIETDLSDEEQAELEELTALFEDFEPGIVVVEVDGQHYIDPLRTFGDVFVQVLAGVDRSDLEEGGILYRLFTGELALFEDFWEDDYGYDSFSDDGDYYEDGVDPEYEEDWDDDFDDEYPEDDIEEPEDDIEYDERFETYDEWGDDFLAYDQDYCWDAGLSYEDCLDQFWEEHGHEYGAVGAEETAVS